MNPLYPVFIALSLVGLVWSIQTWLAGITRERTKYLAEINIASFDAQFTAVLSKRFEAIEKILSEVKEIADSEIDFKDAIDQVNSKIRQLNSIARKLYHCCQQIEAHEQIKNKYKYVDEPQWVSLANKIEEDVTALQNRFVAVDSRLKLTLFYYTLESDLEATMMGLHNEIWKFKKEQAMHISIMYFWRLRNLRDKNYIDE